VQAFRPAVPTVSAAVVLMQVRRESGSGRRTALRGRNGPLAGQLRETTPTRWETRVGDPGLA